MSFDSVGDNAAFRAKFEFPYALLCDTDKQMSIAYGAADDASAGYPKRITVIVGPDGNVQRVFDSVKPADNPKEVLDAI